jgi:ORF6N domain
MDTSHDSTLPLKIGAGEIQRLFYHDRPVVTFEQIAAVHGTDTSHLRQMFRRHKSKLVEGKDYFRLDFTEANQLLLRVTVGGNGLVVFTEGGYLLLVKPMRDDVSWDVQRTMRDAYFKVQQDMPMTLEDLIVQQAVALRDQKRQLQAIEEQQRQDQLMLIRTQQDVIALQQELIIAKDTALEARDNAALALSSVVWVTIRQYVEMHQLHHQMPPTMQRNYATWLTTYCLEHGSAMYKAETADKAWLHERTYSIAVLDKTLNAWLARRTGSEQQNL